MQHYLMRFFKHVYSSMTLIFRSFLMTAMLLLGVPIVQATTMVVMLVTGTPVPNADRAGAGVAVIYNDKAYLFDIGGGVVKHCMEAWQTKGY